MAATLIASQQPWTSAKYSPMLELAQLQLLKKSKYSNFLKCSRLCIALWSIAGKSLETKCRQSSAIWEPGGNWEGGLFVEEGFAEERFAEGAENTGGLD